MYYIPDLSTYKTLKISLLGIIFHSWNRPADLSFARLHGGSSRICDSTHHPRDRGWQRLEEPHSMLHKILPECWSYLVNAHYWRQLLPDESESPTLGRVFHGFVLGSTSISWGLYMRMTCSIQFERLTHTVGLQLILSVALSHSSRWHFLRVLSLVLAVLPSFSGPLAVAPFWSLL